MASSVVKCRCCQTTEGPLNVETVDRQKGKAVLYTEIIRQLCPEYDIGGKQEPIMLCASCAENAKYFLKFMQDTRKEILRTESIHSHTNPPEMHPFCGCCYSRRYLIRLESDDVCRIEFNFLNVNKTTGTHLCAECHLILTKLHKFKQNIIRTGSNDHFFKIATEIDTGIVYKLGSTLDIIQEFVGDTPLIDERVSKRAECVSNDSMINALFDKIPDANKVLPKNAPGLQLTIDNEEEYQDNKELDDEIMYTGTYFIPKETEIKILDSKICDATELLSKNVPELQLTIDNKEEYPDNTELDGGIVHTGTHYIPNETMIKTLDGKIRDANELLSKNVPELDTGIVCKMESTIDIEEEYLDDKIPEATSVGAGADCVPEKSRTNSSVRKVFACDYCDKRFARKYLLQRHSVVHTQKKPFECQQCKKRFGYEQSLRSHLNTHATEPKQRKCRYCGQLFNHIQGWKTHLLVHTGDKKHKCTYCDMRFSYYNTMKAHVFTHTGVSEYKCKTCDRMFPYIQSLNAHKCKAAQTVK